MKQTLRFSVSIISLFLLILITACQPKQEFSEKSPGEKLFTTNCQSCHILPKPSMRTDIEWPALVAEYGQKAKLTSIEIEKITDYLIRSN